MLITLSQSNIFEYKNGSLPHYGDQALFLLEYLKDKKEFNKDDFYKF